MLLSFPPARDADASVSRIALIRNVAEIERVAGEIAKRESAKATLEAELLKLPQAEADREAAIDRDSRTLLNRLADGLQASLAAFGGRAEEITARIEKSAHAASVARRALSSLDAEIERLKSQLAELEANRPELIAAATAEAAQPLVDGFAETLENLRTYMAQLAGLERYLNIARHGRVVATLPDFSGLDGFDTQAVVASAREIEKARAAFAAYAELLVQDARTPVDKLLLPEVDGSPDDGVPYHELSSIERARIDAAFVPPQTRQRPTEDSIALAEQIAGQIEDFNSRVTTA